VTAAPWIDPSSIGRSVLVAIAVVALLVRRRVPVSAMVLGSVTLVATLDQSGTVPTLIAVWIILLTVAVTVDSGQRRRGPARARRPAGGARRRGDGW
jgi:hypothetical protein